MGKPLPEDSRRWRLHRAANSKPELSVLLDEYMVDGACAPLPKLRAMWQG